MELRSFGSYQILEKLAEKGHTQVFLALHNKLQRKTILKIYIGMDAESIKRLEREAQVVAALLDDSFVRIYDYGEIDGKYFISMEYVEGGNLAVYLKKHQLSHKEIIEITYRIARSLAVLHEKNYIHRDLKPENILIDNSGKIKITDFGISLHPSFTKMTQEGDLLGTPLYMSPEQINNKQLTPASDLFSLGVIYYQMITGENPFEAETIGEIFSKILSFRPRSIIEYKATFPNWFVKLVEKLLEKDSTKRFENAGEVVNIIEENWSESDTMTASNKLKMPAKRIKVLFWSIFAFIITGVFFTIFFFGRKERSENIDYPFTNNSMKEKTPLLIDSTTLALRKVEELSLISPPKSDKTKDYTFIAESRDTGFSTMDTIQIIDRIESAQNASIFLKTWPWCEIYLNKRFIDVTPMKEALVIKPGKYNLTLKNPAFPVWSDSISLSIGQKLKLEYKLDSLFYQLDLNVVPWGEIYIDNEFIGTTPLTQPIYLTKKNHELKIINRYFNEWKEPLVWDGKNIMAKFVVLKADSTASKQYD